MKLNIFSADPVAYVAEKVQERFSLSQEQLINAINNKDVTTLRAASNHFFYTSGEYRRLVEYRAYLLRNDHIVFPAAKCSSAAWKKVDDYLSRKNIRDEHSNIALHYMRDGAWFGYERELGDSIYFQTLSVNHCRSRGIANGVRMVEFDLQFFSQFRGAEMQAVINGMPEEIVKGYNKYQAHRSEDTRWLLLDTNVARCHMAPDGIPPLIAVLVDIMNLERYKQLNLLGEELNVYKILIQKLPLNKDGELPFLAPEIQQFHTNLRQMVKQPVDVVTTPCDVDIVDLQSRVSENVDRVNDGLNIVYSTAGTPMLLFNSKNGGAYGLKESINVDTAAMKPLAQEYESWYKQKFLMDYKAPTHIQFLLTTEHNKDDALAQLQQAATLGFPTKMATAAILGIENMSDLLDYENNQLNLVEAMIPAVSSYNSSEGGAPTKSESQLTDEGLKTRTSEKNLVE